MRAKPSAALLVTTAPLGVAAFLRPSIGFFQGKILRGLRLSPFDKTEQHSSHFRLISIEGILHTKFPP